MSLNEVWEAASASPYSPLISKDQQFFVGFSLLLSALVLTGLFGLNRSFLSIASFGVPASLAFGFGAVYMICAAGVYTHLYISSPYPNNLLLGARYHVPLAISIDVARAMATTESAPIFSAVSSNAHQLYTLLQCIGFASKATVQITPDGIRFSAEETRVIQGFAFLDKALFTSYTFNPPPGQRNTIDDSDDDEVGEDATDVASYPCFVISLSALLETLKIFGINDASSGNFSRAGSVQPPNPSALSAFTAPALLLDRSCTLQYLHDGAPFSVTLSETGIKTTCDLTTYEPEDTDLDIPFQRDGIVMKIIMRSAWLHNAITELDATDPTVLKLSASATREPYFALSGSGGPLSESTVEFSIEQPNHGTGPADSHHKVLTDDGTSRSRAKRAKLAPTVTETFLVSPPSSMGSRITQGYRFSMIKKAARAMAVANKVSIRGDRQGVLSLQFMIEFDNNGPVGAASGTRSSAGSAGGTVTFVDFRFVPLLDEDAMDLELD
ncbi:putative DNA repair protein Rad1 [Aspergillus clavatus NRRL 1]|uniref:DNA repair protein Rad1, putative n=1 Tax=Aspergillus clavatus (strain ATCC 1007 / CBS 513.65 / DSM 816 / NCTC 3887 / NRRL 1 / QM 1276 / 107) TaxID=344612 RepID=A1CII8_ASPCL|nr:DNA repair protein Rad1, putative [Aspergillus clavatus NRRL 1]EAW10693.1 DNA repair protein Rad1, putative [Aspergillus clavatus NRRL 1]